MKAVRPLSFVGKVASLSLRRIVSSSFSSGNAKLMNQFHEDSKERTPVCRYALKFQWNSASFVGSVEGPLEVLRTTGDGLGVSTFLRVRSSSESTSTFRILLLMWGEMAEAALKQLKPNDFICVEGLLKSYKRSDENGSSKLYYEVTAKKLNHVAQNGQGSRESESEAGGSGFTKHKKRLQLWQLFFSNPDGWWDYRKCKSNPSYPDLTNKNTGEALWLNPYDPPWIRKQLELLDCRRAETQGGNGAERYKKNLHLWQVFFSNPNEWLDFRKGKSNPKHPDFKNKDTGEALWLSKDDPPWIKRQLELLDSKRANRDRNRNDRADSHSCISRWV